MGESGYVYSKLEYKCCLQHHWSYNCISLPVILLVFIKLHLSWKVYYYTKFKFMYEKSWDSKVRSQAHKNPLIITYTRSSWILSSESSKRKIK